MKKQFFIFFIVFMVGCAKPHKESCDMYVHIIDDVKLSILHNDYDRFYKLLSPYIQEDYDVSGIKRFIETMKRRGTIFDIEDCFVLSGEINLRFTQDGDVRDYIEMKAIQINGVQYIDDFKFIFGGGCGINMKDFKKSNPVITQIIFR